MMANVVVLGAGAWGTSLAIQACRAGNGVTLWAYLEEERDSIQKHNENTLRLPGVKLPKNLVVTCDLNCLVTAEVVLLVTPAQSVRKFLHTIKAVINKNAVLVICSKGIEIETGLLLSEICREIIPEVKLAALSGPNFAQEIANDSIGAACIGSQSITQSTELASLLGSHNYRIYPTDDIIGVQVGGALKNVIAIAAGIVAGAKLGENARAALITRGLREISRLGMAMNANLETFMGLSGMGDLLLCCVSETSRNMKFGTEIGRGKIVNELLQQGQPLAEGAYTVKAVVDLARKYALDMPICNTVYEVVYNGMPIADAISGLLTRKQVNENL